MLIKLIDFVKAHNIDINAPYFVYVYEDGNDIESPLNDLYITRVEIEASCITINTTANQDNI